MRISDWSSDVCSSDLDGSIRPYAGGEAAISSASRPGASSLRRISPSPAPAPRPWPSCAPPDRKSVVSGQSVSVRVDLGGRRIIKKKRQHTHTHNTITKHHNNHIILIIELLQHR